MCDLGLPCGKLDCPFTPGNAVETRRIESPVWFERTKVAGLSRTRARNTIGQRGAIRSRLPLAPTCGENSLLIFGSRLLHSPQQFLQRRHLAISVQPDYFRPHLCRSHLIVHSPNASAINSSAVWVGMLISQTPSRLDTFEMWQQESAACANWFALSSNFAR